MDHVYRLLPGVSVRNSIFTERLFRDRDNLFSLSYGSITAVSYHVSHTHAHTVDEGTIL